MFYCEACRVKNGWTRGIRGFPTSRGRCEWCLKQSDCYDVPSHALTPVEFKKGCEVSGCSRSAIKGRRLCEFHAYPAERPKSDRRAAIEATKKRKAKDSD